MKISFEPPLIIGALCEGEKDIPREMFRAFGHLKPRVAFLPFVVERRHLRNTVACMRLMDIAGLAVFGRLRTEITRYLPSLDKGAKLSGEVDVVVRRGKKFVGIDVSNYINSLTKRRPKGKKQMGLFYQTHVELLTGIA